MSIPTCKLYVCVDGHTGSCLCTMSVARIEQCFWAGLWLNGACRRAVSWPQWSVLLWRYHLHVVTSPVHAPLNQHPHISKAMAAVGHLDSCNMNTLFGWPVCGFSVYVNQQLLSFDPKVFN